jgi:hypothetical protein
LNLARKSSPTYKGVAMESTLGLRPRDWERAGDMIDWVDVITDKISDAFLEGKPDRTSIHRDSISICFQVGSNFYVGCEGHL